ncbi:lipase family alpha/beta hydrolase [Streptomyces sp. NPDC018031]|uniref:lipase family alpha/beta hydrolase n=1 Tax=Streptomyces sp. NPDC018031 TaxID=3365033 RepID=UPI00378B9256
MALPFPLSFFEPLRSSTALIRATAVDAAVLAGHLMLYPTGLAQERPPAAAAEGDGRGRGPGRGKHRPVLLLHGFIDNRSVFVLLRRSLRQDGRHHVEGLNYSPLTCDIPTAAALLGDHVQEVCKRTGRRRVDLVGHSLGGLIARYYVQRLGGDARVHTLVTLGTPHGGTRAVPLLSAHPLVRQMRPDSPVIEALRQPAPGCRTRFISFWSDMDQVVTPAEMACVRHPDLDARNVRVTGIGHLALPVHRTIATGVRRALDGDTTPVTEADDPDTPDTGADGSTGSAGSSGGAQGARGAKPGGDDASGAASVA